MTNPIIKANADLIDKKPGVLDAIKTGSLTYEKLRLISDNQARYAFSAEEKQLLNAALREAIPTIPQTCSQCGMVGENCTCNRSWY